MPKKRKTRTSTRGAAHQRAVDDAHALHALDRLAEKRQTIIKERKAIIDRDHAWGN